MKNIHSGFVLGSLNSLVFTLYHCNVPLQQLLSFGVYLVVTLHDIVDITLALCRTRTI